MLPGLTTTLLVGSAVLGLLAVVNLVRRRPVDDPLVIGGLLVEVALLVALVIGLVNSSQLSDGGVRATFIAYLFTVLVVLPATLFIAIKEKTQWSMAVVVGGAVVVAILVARIQQIWNLHV